MTSKNSTKILGKILLLSVLIATPLILIASILKSPLIAGSVSALLLLFCSFAFYFFRDPERMVPVSDDVVLSPADGKVISIREIYEEQFLKGEALEISVFMSIWDVHVNRVPVSGVVKFVERIPGKYSLAYRPWASDKNARVILGIENRDLKVLVRQVAGFITRRIVCNLRVDDRVSLGERFGMILLGSRLDVVLPKDKVILKIKVGDRAIAGETILAVVKKENHA
jgi:phosphatidylserine decarboxylase